MNEVKDKVWFLRGGLFAKYVVALVGPRRVRARGQRRDGNLDQLPRHQDHADATRWARRPRRPRERIEQSMSDLERQISWVTRASSTHHRAAPRRLRPAAEPGAGGQPAVPAQRPGPRAAAAVARRPSRSAATPISPATSASPRRSPRGVSFAAGLFPRTSRPSCRSRLAHSGFNAGVTVAEIDLGFLDDFLGDAQVGRARLRLCRRPARARCWRAPPGARRSARIFRTLPQVAALMRAGGSALASGTDARRPCRC